MTTKKKTKYSNKKIEIDGRIFDSLAEAKFYERLKLLEKAGIVERFSLQPKFVLLEPFEKMGIKHRAITYTADFHVWLMDGKREVIDIKGFEPRDFPLRRKMFDKRYPDLELKILAYAGGDFMPLDDLKKIRAERKKAKGRG